VRDIVGRVPARREGQVVAAGERLDGVVTVRVRERVGRAVDIGRAGVRLDLGQRVAVGVGQRAGDGTGRQRAVRDGGVLSA